MSPLRLATQRNGLELKAATDLDDQAWFLANRRFRWPALPSDPGAPDYYSYTSLKKLRAAEDPRKLNFGIWDKKNFDHIAFLGFASLQPYSGNNDWQEVGCLIVSDYRMALDP